MAVSKAQKAATAKYEAKVYDKVLVRLPRGKKSEIEAHIKPKGESLNGFISTAIDEKLERDKEKEAGGVTPRPSISAISRAQTTKATNCTVYWLCEFNKNSTPLQKVELRYRTIGRTKTEETFVFKSFGDIIKRCYTRLFELITRRPQVRVLPPQP